MVIKRALLIAAAATLLTAPALAAATMLPLRRRGRGHAKLLEGAPQSDSRRRPAA